MRSHLLGIGQELLQSSPPALRMEVEPVKESLGLVEQNDSQGVIVTDYQSKIWRKKLREISSAESRSTLWKAQGSPS